MKTNDFIRYLKINNVEVVSTTGKHPKKAVLGEHVVPIPSGPEIKGPTAKDICKQLGIKRMI